MQETPEQLAKRLEREFDEFIDLLAQEHGIAVKQGEEWKCLFDFEYRKILVSDKYGIWLFYNLTPRQKKYLGQKISPFACYKTVRLCDGEHLIPNNPEWTRPHFTCVICYLRKVIEGKKPRTVPIALHMVFLHKFKPTWKRRIAHFITRYLLTFAEALGSV
jgi:hypothetical protein